MPTKRGITVSAETRRRWVHEVGWVWKRAKLVAKDDDPQRVTRLARIRYGFAPLTCVEAMVFADELDIPLWPKVGCAWRPKGTQLRVTLLWLPTSCPRANPIERACGDVHDCCTRNHQRQRLPALVAEVEDHVHLNGPWRYQLSDLYTEPAVTAAVEKIAQEEHAKTTA